MRSWPGVPVPTIPGEGPVPQVTDTSSGSVLALRDPDSSGPATLYVCGITPYDATHLGHAATYVTFDIVGRVLRDAGHEVAYAQNVTDVDDPLLERATRDGVDWHELAEQQTQLFRDDMTALRVIPPDHYVGVVESMASIGEAVAQLLAVGLAYRVAATDPAEVAAGVADDVYLDLARCPDFGSTSGWDEGQMAAVFAERGGDPGRPGKRTPFDPLLWRAARPGEPSWPHRDAAGVQALPDGRPGWHIECTTIAEQSLGLPIDIQGGGVDLIFPHHEMSAVQSSALRPGRSFARRYVHQEMVSYQGHKMSKSRGNLVLVSRLRAEGADPMAIRTALLDHPYHTPWEWHDDDLQRATRRVATWRAALNGTEDASAVNGVSAGSGGARQLIAEVRAALANDLDTPAALTALDRWAAAAPHESADADAVREAVDALLGLAL